MASAGIRELKDNLSDYVRRTENGERIAVTAHGRVVAELVPAGTSTKTRHRTRYQELVAAGIIRPALQPGEALGDWPEIELPRGTAAELLDSDRGEA